MCFEEQNIPSHQQPRCSGQRQAAAARDWARRPRCRPQPPAETKYYFSSNTTSESITWEGDKIFTAIPEYGAVQVVDVSNRPHACRGIDRRVCPEQDGGASGGDEEQRGAEAKPYLQRPGTGEGLCNNGQYHGHSRELWSTRRHLT